MPRRSYLALKSNDTGADSVYQVDSADHSTIPNLLSGSKLSLIRLPYCIENSLGYRIIQRQFRLHEQHHSHELMATLSPDQIEEVFEWFES